MMAISRYMEMKLNEFRRFAVILIVLEEQNSHKKTKYKHNNPPRGLHALTAG